jgi:hypothetical protein
MPTRRCPAPSWCHLTQQGECSERRCGCSSGYLHVPCLGQHLIASLVQLRTSTRRTIRDPNRSAIGRYMDLFGSVCPTHGHKGSPTLQCRKDLSLRTPLPSSVPSRYYRGSLSCKIQIHYDQHLPRSNFGRQRCLDLCARIPSQYHASSAYRPSMGAPYLNWRRLVAGSTHLSYTFRARVLAPSALAVSLCRISNNLFFCSQPISTWPRSVDLGTYLWHSAARVYPWKLSREGPYLGHARSGEGGPG